MRVLLVNAVYGYGSTGLICKDIAETLTEYGGEAFIAYQTAQGNIENGYQVGGKIGWKAHALLCRLLGREGYYSRYSTKKLIKYIEKIKPDVVHLHNLHSNYVNLNGLLKYLAKKDICTVVTMHDCWFFTGKCTHFIDINCDKYKRGCEKCPKKNYNPKSIFFDFAKKVNKDRVKYFSAIKHIKFVGCSYWITSLFKESLLKELPATTVHNGIDTSVFKPTKSDIRREWGVLDSDKVVLGMANKWLSELNKSLFEKVRNSENLGYKLVLIGCTEEQKKIYENENVLCLGFVKDREILAKIYSAGDVFANVTHADTLPTVNMESICTGTPVVTYDACGSPELVLDGCGKIVKEYDEEGLLKAIDEALKEKFDCASIGKENFDKTNCYKEYLNIYRELINEKEKEK